MLLKAYCMSYCCGSGFLIRAHQSLATPTVTMQEVLNQWLMGRRVLVATTTQWQMAPPLPNAWEHNSAHHVTSPHFPIPSTHNLLHNIMYIRHSTLPMGTSILKYACLLSQSATLPCGTHTHIHYSHICT